MLWGCRRVHPPACLAVPSRGDRSTRGLNVSLAAAMSVTTQASGSHVSPVLCQPVLLVGGEWRRDRRPVLPRTPRAFEPLLGTRPCV